MKIRTAPAAEAIAAARAALAWLRAAGTSRFYWKYCSTFNSTPQGNIGPVAEALIADIGTDQTIYCPAFSENERTVFMGHLFVDNQLLAESPMKDHPLTPMRDSNLLRLLSLQVKSKPGLVDWQTVARGREALTDRLQHLKAQGIAHVIVDAISNADLSTIAEATFDFPLLTGGSALALPLSALLEKAGFLPQPSAAARPATSGGKIILSGSCSAMTLRQVACHAAKASAFCFDPLTLAKEGPGAAIAWLASQPLIELKILYATAAPEDVRRVQAALASLARAALKLRMRRFIVVGGETSGAIVQALGITRLSIGPEIAPGVPWTFGASGGIPVAL